MPELPEVETVRRGLAPVMEGGVIAGVTLNRPDLRFPFAPDFRERLTGKKITQLGRRAKFLDMRLSSGDRVLLHLGMSGRFTVRQPNDAEQRPGDFLYAADTNPKHDHVVFDMQSGAQIIYNDPRRFGFMELLAPGDASRLDDLGPEPLSNAFNAPDFVTRTTGRRSPVKTALLDQRIVAGLGNIYVCEALWRSRIKPDRAVGRLSGDETETLVGHIKDVIAEAIEAGGSSLRDFASADGALGYFQHRFDVYGREGEACRACGTPVARMVQSGRSTFFCPSCQST